LFAHRKTKTSPKKQSLPQKPKAKPETTQTSMAFDIPDDVPVNRKVILQKQDGTILKYHILPIGAAADNDYIYLEPHSPLSEMITGRKKGDKFQFHGEWYKIIEKVW